MKKHTQTKDPRDSLAFEHGSDHTHTHKAPKCVIVNRMRKNAANTYRQKRFTLRQMRTLSGRKASPSDRMKTEHLQAEKVYL